MSTTTSSTAPTARKHTRGFKSGEKNRARRAQAQSIPAAGDRTDAEAAIGAAFRPQLQRELDAVARAAAAHREAEATHQQSRATMERLCGSLEERQALQTAAYNSVPIPDELKTVRKTGKFITRMLVVWSDGEVMRDINTDVPPFIDWSSSYELTQALDDQELGPKVRPLMHQWMKAKAAAAAAVWSDEQAAAISAHHVAWLHWSNSEAALTRALGKLLRVPCNSLEEIAAKVAAWGSAWDILKPGGKIATGQMEDFDNQMMLAIIGEDLLRGASRAAR